MTHDTLHVTGGRRWTFFQNFSTLAFTVWKWRFVEDIFTKDHSLSLLINDKGVCRTAPATPGLVKWLGILLLVYFLCNAINFDALAQDYNLLLSCCANIICNMPSSRDIYILFAFNWYPLNESSTPARLQESLSTLWIPWTTRDALNTLDH